MMGIRFPRASVIALVITLACVLLFLVHRIGVLRSTPALAPTDSRDDGPQEDSEPPPGYTVKGNISVTTGEKLYHVPGMRDYDITVIDPSRGERWFRTEEEAIANGWQRAVPR